MIASLKLRLKQSLTIFFFRNRNNQSFSFPCRKIPRLMSTPYSQFDDIQQPSENRAVARQGSSLCAWDMCLSRMTP